MLAEHLGAEPDNETENLFRMIETPSFHTTTRPQTRYVRSGDAYLAYQIIGEGPVDLLHIATRDKIVDHKDGIFSFEGKQLG